MRPRPSRLPVFRIPSIRSVVVIVLAVVSGLAVHQATATASATAARYGAAVEVQVATRDLRPGEVLTADAVSTTRRPAAFVPAAALPAAPLGQTVTAGIAAGEVLVGPRFGGTRHGTAALVPPGRRAIAIAAFDASLPVEVGDLVDVLATSDGAGGRAQVVAADALVVHVSEDAAITVAVTAAEAPRVAAALATAAVVLALVG